MLYSRVVLLLAVLGCSSKSAEPDKGSGIATRPTAGTTKAPAGDRYFEFTVDGKPYTIEPGDVSSTFRSVGDHAEFKVFAGKDGATGISLVVTSPMTGPSSTPNGSTVVESGLSQGSVSLHQFPEKGYTTNSFNATYPEMAVVVPDAVVITSIDADGKDAKVVTGTFETKTYGTHSKGTPDPKDTDHVVKGKFRIRHEFSSMTGDRF
ncbi:MAG: hypothetical protein WKG01_26890 [Kofleriaceae bacterium]